MMGHACGQPEAGHVRHMPRTLGLHPPLYREHSAYARPCAEWRAVATWTRSKVAVADLASLVVNRRGKVAIRVAATLALSQRLLVFFSGRCRRRERITP